MDSLKLTRLHVHMHAWYLILVPVGGLLASQAGLLGRMVMQIAPALILERMVVIETTSGIRLMRLTLPVSRRAIVLADLLFSYAVVLCAAISAWFPALLGLSHTFAPTLVDLMSLVTLAAVISFTYNAVGPTTSTLVTMGLLLANAVVTFLVPHGEILTRGPTTGAALLCIATVTTALTLLIPGTRWYAPIDLLPPAE